ncbi:ABC transporter family substrate-binding protein [Curtobacterium sp. MCBA15_012]|uniref:ABC transporter family substrate-binding protein n=1 Tax=Curtobacterium sp. MCBA15_012 TaxID=1898738 RepID=UPI0008DE4540|nr:ABC transporter family substrate-binding protein [Curtobacterium sp. MCBA15_012]WIB00987.1 ABC transporter family substrate-binding protein [Curtobacterium sp. MCBA15_012]
MKHRNVLALTAALAGFALVATGCSSGSNGGSGGASDDSGKKTLPTTAQINEHPVSDLEQGGTLRLPISQWITQWNYNQVDGALVDAATIEQATMPFVYTIDGKGAPELDTDYVSKAEATSDDPLTIEYTINPDAKWNDGSAITWKDFENEWKALNGSNKEYLVGSTTGYEDIASVSQGSDERDVKVVFSKPFSDWKSLFSPLYPASQTDTPEKFNEAYKGNVPVSSGPYKVGKLDETAQTVTIVPDSNWWGEKPKLDQVIFRALDGNADVDAYLNKEIDSVLTTTSERFDRVKDAKDSKIYASTSAQYTHVDFSSKGILKDKQLRLAIQHSVNREALAQVIGGTLPYKLGTLDNHLFLSTDDGYQSNTDPNGTFDVEKAKKILDDDGWKTDGTYRKKDGKTLSLSITIPSGATSSQKLSEVMQQQLKDVGIQLKLKSVAVDDFFEQYVTPGNYDMTIFVWGGTGFHSSSASIYTTGDTGQNYGRIADSTIDALVKKAIAEPDTTKANKIWNQIDEKVWAIGHSMPITAKPALVAQNPKLANYGAFAGAQNIDWTKVGFTK